MIARTLRRVLGIKSPSAHALELGRYIHTVIETWLRWPWECSAGPRCEPRRYTITGRRWRRKTRAPGDVRCVP